MIIIRKCYFKLKQSRSGRRSGRCCSGRSGRRCSGSRCSGRIWSKPLRDGRN